VYQTIHLALPAQHHYWKDRKKKLVVHSELQEDVLGSVHDSKAAGHLGQKKTYQKLWNSFFGTDWRMTKTCTYRLAVYHLDSPLEWVQWNISRDSRLTFSGWIHCKIERSI
jgi:hypothetical protein